ncbi:MAG: glycosyltransferase family 2 protein [Chroococcidiopsidaceae cyanobacterium CP_BM_RX_35]|nr:glycosyltransferase family 2 protein [Chroococcidiopsidaceae cyanobacterium CP_BM_RX_35]
MKPLVSVCVPTYNGAKYLRECLDSVLAQTFTNFELIVVDDHSSDETLSIAQEYATQDFRIRVDQNKHNLGLVGNWNRCVELAQGEWIKFVFQDDLIEPTCLEQMLAASKPESAIICCRRIFMFEPGIPEDTRQEYRDFAENASMSKVFPNLTEISASDYCQAILDQSSYIINFVGEPTSVMLHRSVFRRFGYFNPYLIMYCDIEFWTRVAVHTGIIYIPETLAKFRVHDKATTVVSRAKRYYRAWMLDLLIFIHDLTFHPVYTPLRTAANNLQPPINLTNLLAQKAYEARRTAESAAADSKNPDPSLLAEWKSVIQYHPLLSVFSKRNLLKHVIVRSLRQWGELKGQLKVMPILSSKS